MKQAAETEVEFLQEQAEKEIVGKNLLGIFGPVIALICANSGNKFNVLIFFQYYLQVG